MIGAGFADMLTALLPHVQIYSTFFCRMNDPSYIKDLKLQILSAVADESNAYDIVTELTEYVADIDEHQSREAVRAVGRIALEVRRKREEARQNSSSAVQGVLAWLIGYLRIAVGQQTRMPAYLPTYLL